MRNTFFKIALAIIFAVKVINASAQTTYTSGLYMTVTKVNNNPVNMWNYFTQDSLATRYFSGPTTFRNISNEAGTFSAILIDVPSASIKKAAVLNPGELKEFFSEMPKFSYTYTNEMQKVAAYMCKRVIATDQRTKRTYDVWVTKDVSLPQAAIPRYYQGIDGFPIKYVSFRDGIENLTTVLTIREVTIPPNTFTVPPDFGRITYNDYKILSGRY